MSRSVSLLTVIFLYSLRSPSAAQWADQSTLTLSSSSTVGTTATAFGAFNRSSENVSAASDPTAAGGTNTTTLPLNASSTAASETPPDAGGHAAPSPGASDTGSADSVTAPVTPTTELRPNTAPPGPGGSRSTATPSAKPTAPAPATPPSTAHATERASPVPSAGPAEKDSTTEEKKQPGKTLGVFIGLAVVLLLVLGLVYLIYNKTQKDDPFSHQRLYDNDPVLSLDVSVEPADRFYGGLTSELGCEGRGDHVTSQRALNQAAGEGDNPTSQTQPRDEIQLKPMSESSVKIFL